MDTGNQINYEDVCLHTGKLFIESRIEIGRLTVMLLELQRKNSELNQEKIQLAAEHKLLSDRIAIYEKLNASN